MSLMKIKDLFHFEKGVLQSSKCIPGEFDFITASSEWKSHNEYTHDCEALIFAAAASGSLGRTHYVNGKFISSDLCFIITPKDQKKYPIDLKFYHLIFQTLKDEIVRNTKAGTSKEAIGLTVFGNYELPYFDIAKQIETKEKFVQAQKPTIGLSTELTHQLALVKQLRQSFLREAMQGKLTADFRSAHPELIEGENSAQALLEKIKVNRNGSLDRSIKKEKELDPVSEDEIPFEIPKSWVWCRLGEISQNRLGKMLDGIKNKGIPLSYLRNTNVQWYSFDLGDIKKMRFEESEFEEYSIKFGDLLICEGGEPGRCAIWQSNDNSYKFQKALHRVRFYDSINSWMYQYYIDYLCRSNYIERYFTGSGIKHLTGKSLNKMVIPLPPLSEQQAIVSKLDELMRTCDELETSIRTSQQQNEMLLQQVLREALEG